MSARKTRLPARTMSRAVSRQSSLWFGSGFSHLLGADLSNQLFAQIYARPRVLRRGRHRDRSQCRHGIPATDWKPPQATLSTVANRRQQPFARNGRTAGVSATQTFAASRSSGRFVVEIRRLSLVCHLRESRRLGTRTYPIRCLEFRSVHFVDLQSHRLSFNLLRPAEIAAQINLAHGMQEVRGSTPLGSTIPSRRFLHHSQWVTRWSTTSLGYCHRSACSPLSPSCHPVWVTRGP